jgi:hypothetical protein
VLNFLDPLNINGLTVFRDDEDPRTFYVLPDVPGIPLDDQGRPDFLFLLYLLDASTLQDGQDTGAGYLQFRTVLTLPQDRRDALVAALRTQLSTEQAAGHKPFGNAITITEPVLADPLWTSGTVDLSTFAVGDTGLVRTATSTVPVDLTGGLGASFTATLSAQGAGVFRGAFDAYRSGTHPLPLVITYHLTYAGRISASMHIEAKHSVIHERVWKRATPWQLLETPFVRYVPLQIEQPFTLNLLPSLRSQFGRVFPMIHVDDFGAAVQETIADNSITVQINEAPTNDPTTDATTRATLLKLATDLLTQSIMPSITSGTNLPGATDSSQPTSNTSLMQLDENAAPGTSTFVLDLSDAMSVTREAAPNAPLQVLIADPATLSNCFQELRLADDFFKEMVVEVSTSGVDFSANGIAKIHVYLQYHEIDEKAIPEPGKPGPVVIDRPFDDVLENATSTLRFQFDTARAADGSHKTAYQYMAEVYWQTGGAPTVVPWTRTNTQRLIITPPLLGAIKVDAVLTAPPASVDSARVELSYTGTDQSTYTGALELTAAAPRASWLQSTGEIVTPDQTPAPPTYSYRVRYRIQDVEIVTPQKSSSQQAIEIPTPFTGAVDFSLHPQGSAATVDSIAGTLTYADPANGYTVVKPINLTPGGPPQEVHIPVMSGGPRTATYTARVINKDGTQVDLPPGTLTEGVNFVGVTALDVQVRTDLIDFNADVKAIHLALKYTHADGTVTTGEYIFNASSPTFEWSVPRLPGDPNEYEADVTFYGIDRSKDQTITLTHQTSTSVELDRSMS